MEKASCLNIQSAGVGLRKGTNAMEMYILLGVGALLIVAVILVYNQLISKKQMVDNGWSDIDVQLKRRADLIPSLVNVVRGYSEHEKTLLTDVVTKRGEALAVKDSPRLRSEKETQISQQLTRVLALAEAYPDLKANEQFLKLQDELVNTEDEISYARRFFNAAVREYNTAIQTFPSNLVAMIFSFREAEFFEIEQIDRQLPSLNLGASA